MRFVMLILFACGATVASAQFGCPNGDCPYQKTTTVVATEAAPQSFGSSGATASYGSSGTTNYRYIVPSRRQYVTFNTSYGSSGSTATVYQRRRGLFGREYYVRMR